MPGFTTPYRYISEAVWLPTYLAVGALLTAFIGGSAVSLIVIFISIIACRMVLEFLYRVAFGDVRLSWQVGAGAFLLQLLAWGALWAWFANKGTA
jgi:hypothetical protein